MRNLFLVALAAVATGSAFGCDWYPGKLLFGGRSHSNSCGTVTYSYSCRPAHTTCAPSCGLVVGGLYGTYTNVVPTAPAGYQFTLVEVRGNLYVWKLEVAGTKPAPTPTPTPDPKPPVQPVVPPKTVPKDDGKRAPLRVGDDEGYKAPKPPFEK